MLKRLLYRLLIRLLKQRLKGYKKDSMWYFEQGEWPNWYQEQGIPNLEKNIKELELKISRK